MTITGQQPQTTQQLAATLYSRLLMQKYFVRQIQDERIAAADRGALALMLRHLIQRRIQTAEALGLAQLALGEQERAAFLMMQGVLVAVPS